MGLVSELGSWDRWFYCSHSGRGAWATVMGVTYAATRALPTPIETIGGVHTLAWPFSLLRRGAWGRMVRNERWWLVYRAEFLSAEGTYVICCGSHSALYYDRDNLALSIGLTGSIPYL